MQNLMYLVPILVVLFTYLITLATMIKCKMDIDDAIMAAMIPTFLVLMAVLAHGAKG